MLSSDEFDRFAKRVYPRLVQLGSALSNDSHEGQDLAQTALLQIWRRWDQLSSDNLEGYALRCVYTRFISNRRSRRAILRPDGWDTLDIVSARDHSPDVEQRLILDEWLGSLPPKQRAVLVLRYLCDLAVKDVAQIMHCRDGTVKSQTAKALSALQARVGTLNRLSSSYTDLEASTHERGRTRSSHDTRGANGR